ncbi:caspase family protein [Psychromonas sp. KJ10-10]|uniref:caspase family protein n=1 Tax=Psychromonas sp. KJ10-10 TaxID=3391823 RepID=UPI0039B680D5
MLAKDANDITNAFTKSMYFQSVKVKTLTDAQATKENILAAKAFLQQAKPQDQVVVFFAGHGFLDEEKNFYFGSSDINPERLSDKGLEYAEINYLLDGINARNKLLLLDSCHSGEVVENYQVKAMPEGVTSRGFAVKSTPKKEQDLAISFDLLQKTFIDLRASTGAVVISACWWIGICVGATPI